MTLGDELITLAGSDRYLSPTVGHASATISIHAAAEGAYERFFAEAEALFRAADGRPHWGKLTLRDPAELRGRYPEVDRFAAIRAQLDPGAMFGNRYLDNVIQPTS